MIKNNNYNFDYEIIPSNGWMKLNLKEIWQYKDLLYIFVWRDVKVRYKQTLIGILWAIFPPLLTMLIFTLFFGKLARIPSNDIPYPIFVFTGLLYWNYFSSALSGSSNSFVESQNIIKKVYFPKLILPLSTVVTPAIDFVLAFLVLIIIMIYYHFTPGVIGLVLSPLLLIISFFSVAGLGLLFASINVKYRDVRYILPFFIQLFLFLTPVIYPIEIIPAQFRWLAFLNPMAGVISIARSTLLRTDLIEWHLLLISLGVSLVLLIVGLGYFRRTERFFADII